MACVPTSTARGSSPSADRTESASYQTAGVKRVWHAEHWTQTSCCPDGARIAASATPATAGSAAVGRAHATSDVAHLLVMHDGVVHLDFQPEDLRRKRTGCRQHRIGRHHAIAL